MSRPIASILVVAGTGRPYLAAALQSLVGQDLGDWEALVLDCAATSAEAEAVARQVREVASSKVRCFPWSGERGFPPRIAKKWNFLLGEAAGEIVCFLDDDDMKEEPRWLSAMCRPILEDPGLAVTLCGGYVTDPSGARQGRLFGEPSLDLAVLLRPNFITMGQVAVRRTTAAAIGGFDEGLACTEDWDFCIRLATHRWRHVDEVSALKRDGADNACYHREVSGWTQEGLRHTIRKHNLAPESCHECAGPFVSPDEPFVWAVPEIGFRFWHYGCALQKQRETGRDGAYKT